MSTIVSITLSISVALAAVSIAAIATAITPIWRVRSIVIVIIIVSTFPRRSTLNSIAKLQPNDIISVKPIALQSINDHSALSHILEIGKGKVDAMPFSCNSRNQPQLSKSLKWTKDVGDFSFGAVDGKTFDVDC